MFVCLWLPSFLVALHGFSQAADRLCCWLLAPAVVVIFIRSVVVLSKLQQFINNYYYSRHMDSIFDQ